MTAAQPAQYRRLRRRGADFVALAAAALAVVSLVPAAQAGASSIGIARDLDKGPLLAGDALAYSEATGDRFSVWTVRPGRGSASLARGKLANLDAETTGESETIALAASARLVAFTDYHRSGSQYGESRAATLWAGPLAGPLATLSRCSYAQSLDQLPSPAQAASPAVAVDAAALAYVDCEGRVIVRDFGADAPVALRALKVAGTPPQLALAGRYLAIRSGRELRVVDWVAGAGAYVVDGLPDTITDPSVARQPAFDLDASGTLALARFGRDASCATGRLEWYSPAQPTPHLLAVKPCVAQVAIAAGRIAAIAAAPRGERTLTLVDLAGRSTAVASVGPPGVQVGEIDFDGSALSYAVRRCSADAELLRVGEGATRPPAIGSVRCPVTIESRSVRVGRGAVVRLGVRCARGCAGRAQLVRGGRRGQAPLAAARPFAFAASRRVQAIRLPLPGTSHRLLGRAHELAAELRLAVTDRDGGQRLVRRRVLIRSRVAIRARGVGNDSAGIALLRTPSRDTTAAPAAPVIVPSTPIEPEVADTARPGSPSSVGISRSARNADRRPGVRAEHGEVERSLRGIHSVESRAGQDTYLVDLQSRHRLVSRSWGVGGTERTDDLSAERQAFAGQRNATTHIPHEPNLAVGVAEYPVAECYLAHAGNTAPPGELATRSNSRGEHACDARAQVSLLDRAVRDLIAGQRR